LSAAAAALPFEGSRRLTGPSLYLTGCGAVLEVPFVPEPAQVADWRERVGWAVAELGWPAGGIAVREHPGGAALAFEAPPDQLFAATEVNEWAWSAACARPVLHAPGHPAAWDRRLALISLRALATGERDPVLRALLQEASTRELPLLWDDETVSIGLGERSQSWPRGDLPDPESVSWSDLGRIPTALVTGSNGKTTTVRLVAACCRAMGWRDGYNCTDGLFIGGELREPGDWSGPAGSRAVLRDTAVQAAVLETARGGLMRRGLAYHQADVAIVTNTSADHFGEYGIHDLESLADAKLVIARGLRPGGLLVLNAGDPRLRARAPAAGVGWFAADADDGFVEERRAAGCPTCAPRGGRLWLQVDGASHDLGAIAELPLAVGGAATYNIANLAGAALVALTLGATPDVIAAVFARFGGQRSDNPGRLQRWRIGGIQVLTDYAHNPDGLQGLLAVARALCGEGRLGLVLGQAGNRTEAEIRALAEAAAAARPWHVVLKDLDGYLRGRVPGEVPGLLAEALLRKGLRVEQLETVLPELGAARALLAWSKPGDVLAIPVHALAARKALTALLDSLEAGGWRAGQPLPAADLSASVPP
jgi:cyanophycin synthetase